MAKDPATSDDFDSPWKDALHLYLDYFLAFFFPDIHGDIDWDRGTRPWTRNSSSSPRVLIDSLGSNPAESFR